MGGCGGSVSQEGVGVVSGGGCGGGVSGGGCAGGCQCHL